MSLKRQYFPVLFRWSADYKIFAILPYQPVPPGQVGTYMPGVGYGTMDFADYGSLPVAEQCDDTDQLLVEIKYVYEPQGHASAYEVRSRGQMPSDWRKKAWGELTDDQRAVFGIQSYVPKPTKWSRSYIEEVGRMMRLLRPMLSETQFNAYIEMWSDTIGLANPRFQRERFRMDCWAREAG